MFDAHFVQLNKPFATFYEVYQPLHVSIVREMFPENPEEMFGNWLS